MDLQFPNHGWILSGLRNLIKKIDQTGSIDSKSGSGDPRSALTNDNTEHIEQILNLETNPGSHLTQPLLKFQNNLRFLKVVLKELLKMI